MGADAREDGVRVAWGRRGRVRRDQGTRGATELGRLDSGWRCHPPERLERTFIWCACGVRWTWVAEVGYKREDNRVGLSEIGPKQASGWDAEARIRRKKKTYSIEPSHPLPDDSTTSTRPSLTSLFGWEAVTLGDVAACASVSPTELCIHHFFTATPSSPSTIFDKTAQERSLGPTVRDNLWSRPPLPDETAPGPSIYVSPI